MNPKLLSCMREIAEKCTSHDPFIDRDYWAAEAAKALPKALEYIDALATQNTRLAKMFVENTYIESATMEPGYYDIRLGGQGAMLVIGQILQIFRESGGKNFITNTLQMTLPDGKTQELYELTIQKVNGEDSPAQKITRLNEQIERFKGRGREA